jgi:hypothetical protein
MRSSRLAAVLLALTLTLSSCSGKTTYAEIASERDETRSEAQEVFPEVISHMSGEFTGGWGEWQYGGTKNTDRRRYAVYAEFDVTSPPNIQSITDLFEKLGYPIVQYPTSSNPALIGEKDGFRLSVSVDDDSSQTVGLRSLWRNMRPNTPQPLVGREPLDLNVPSPTPT